MINRKDCIEIIKKSEVFYKQNYQIDNYEIESYNYRLASYKDFEETNGFELRGITFVKNNNNWDKWLLLHKFFNINQVPGYMYQDLKNKKIIGVYEKLDGSLISFIKLPNNKIIAKTKMSFESEQALASQNLYNTNKNLKSFIDENIDKYYLMFEYISPFNQIVINYNKSELVVLQMRNKKNGKYLSRKEIEKINEKYNLKLSKKYSKEYYNLDFLINKCKIEKEIEGYVVLFEDGQIVKMKTEWYFNLHGLLTNETVENLLIKHILNETIDDVLSQLKEDSEKKSFILKNINLVNKYFNHKIIEILDYRKKYFIEYEENKKRFAIENKNYKYFGIVMKSINIEKNIEEKVEKMLKEKIFIDTNKLNKAKLFLKEIEKDLKNI